MDPPKTAIGKVSFGFKAAKIPAKFVPVKPKDTQKREFIESIEVGGIIASESKEEETPKLCIPMPTTGSYKDKLKAVQKKAEVAVATVKSLSELTLEQRAELEILNSLKQQGDDEEVSNLVIPNVSTSSEGVSNTKEPSMDDYESVPITGFGLAMLRGMGLKEEPTTSAPANDIDEFKFRPKGLGLGAESSIKQRALKVALKSNEVLQLKKGAYVVILAGNFKDFYGMIKGLDEDTGRIVVSLALGGKPVVLGEKFVQLVTEKEYQIYSKKPVFNEKTKPDSKEKTYGLVIGEDSKSRDRDEESRSRDREEESHKHAKHKSKYPDYDDRGRKHRSRSSDRHRKDSHRHDDSRSSHKSKKHKSRSRRSRSRSR